MYKTGYNDGYKDGYEPNEQIPERPVLQIANLAHKNQLINQNNFVCVYIYGDWCGPCKTIAPAFSQIAAQYTKVGSCIVAKYNFNNMSPEETSAVNGVPYFEFYLRGKKVGDVLGGDLNSVEENIRKFTGIQTDYGGPIKNRGVRKFGAESRVQYEHPDANYASQDVVVKVPSNPNRGAEGYANVTYGAQQGLHPQQGSQFAQQGFAPQQGVSQQGFAPQQGFVPNQGFRQQPPVQAPPPPIPQRQVNQGYFSSSTSSVNAYNAPDPYQKFSYDGY